MKFIFPIIFICFLFIPLPSYSQSTSIIPAPNNIKISSGSFILSEATAIKAPKEWDNVLTYFKEKINKKNSVSIKNVNDIVFEKSETLNHKEAYSIDIKPHLITIKAAEPNGAFYAIQTLLQLLPIDFYKAIDSSYSWKIPCLEIKDQPRFTYRGLHLDVCRHFFTVDEVKEYLDIMAFHKYNHFHWHLTEDQGWRIEIKQYPKLTSIGGYRKETLVGHYNDQPHQFDGKEHQGFYTQEQIKEIVAYAAARYITVIPEIEMPGHAQAAIAAYPELSCTQEPLEVMNVWGISDEVFCPTETTFEFLENVLSEVVELFPGKYIHIGGDECPKTRWKESDFCQNLMKEKGLKDEHELQSYFIGRIEKYLNYKGKSIIGWDEILEGGLAPNATVMSWRGIAGGIEAAKQKHPVIMTPTSHCYFDYYQTQHKDAALAIGGFLPIETVYNYEPIPEELSQEETTYILGAQANLWTEYIDSRDKLYYMAYPRATALSEVLWSRKDQKNLPNFLERLPFQMERLKQQGINVANHIYDVAANVESTGEHVEVSLSALSNQVDIHYTLDGSEVTTQSLKYKEPIVIDKSTTVKSIAFLNGKVAGLDNTQVVEMHKAMGKSITFKDNPHPKYAAGGKDCLINGVKGNDGRYGDAEWLGFYGKNVEAVIDLKTVQDIRQVTLRFFNGPGQWIYMPRKITLSTSKNGQAFQVVKSLEGVKGYDLVVEIPMMLKAVSAQYLKVEVERYGIIPDGAQGAGNEAWLFIDEIVVD